ncbi:MAG: acyltransferase, partial [Muribaculaceae bacterium]|nr:acyltransferase [Muribaculaceae bacterium]
GQNRMSRQAHSADVAGVDVAKFLAALVVMLFHLVLLVGDDAVNPRILNYLAYISLGFFFIVSGYFLQKSISSADDVRESYAYCIRRGTKVFRLWLIWVLVSTPFSMYYYSMTDCSLMTAVEKFFCGILMRGQCEFAWQLWFLYSLGITTLVVGLSRRKGWRMRWLLLVYMVVALVEYDLHDNCNRFLQYILHYSLGGGLPIICGMYLCRFESKMCRMPVALVLLLLSVAMYGLSLPLWQPPAGAAIMIAALKVPLRGNRFTMYLRRQSMWIYYLHMYSICILVYMLGVQFADFWSAYLAVGGLTLSVAAVMIAIQNHLIRQKSCQGLLKD